jgi:lipopolysaccharide/colanic/teichoic acid biosynthesis glycosyltransferase
MRGKLFLKRVLDFAVSFVGLVLLTVPFVIIALAIKLDSKGSVFFRQERVGKDGRSFKVWKFRTMVVGTEGLSEE